MGDYDSYMYDKVSASTRAVGTQSVTASRFTPTLRRGSIAEADLSCAVHGANIGA